MLICCNIHFAPPLPHFYIYIYIYIYICNEESYCYVCVTTMINVLTIRSNKLVIILVNSKY